MPASREASFLARSRSAGGSDAQPLYRPRSLWGTARPLIARGLGAPARELDALEGSNAASRFLCCPKGHAPIAVRARTPLRGSLMRRFNLTSSARRSNRRLFLEQLEQRQMLASVPVALADPL